MAGKDNRGGSGKLRTKRAKQPSSLSKGKLANTFDIRKKGKAVKKGKPLKADGDPAGCNAECREERAGEAEDGGEDRRAATEHDYRKDSRAARKADNKKERSAAEAAEDEEDEDEYDEDEKDQQDEENVVKYEENKPEGEDG